MQILLSMKNQIDIVSYIFINSFINISVETHFSEKCKCVDKKCVLGQNECVPDLCVGENTCSHGTCNMNFLSAMSCT